MKDIDLQALGPDWRLVHTDEARWSPMPGHEYSVSAHAPYGQVTWVVAYFEPDARTGVWIEGAAPAESQHAHAFQAAKAAQEHWAKHRGLRIVNPRVHYRIQPSGMEVEGTSVGRYLAIRKYEPSPRYKRYVIDHVPTGYKMFEYERLKTARTVAKALDARFGDALDFTDPVDAARLSRIDAELLDWARLAAQYPTLEELRAARAQKQAKQDALEQEKRAWEGKWMHWTADSMRYGEEAKILRVHEVDPAGTERGPERLKADLEYSPTRGGLGVQLYLDGIEMGRAPADLPWAELRRGREWGARIHNVVFRIAQISERYLLWTVGPGISESDPPMFGSRAEAEQAAAEFAAQHGVVRSNPLSPIKERLLAY